MRPWRSIRRTAIGLRSVTTASCLRRPAPLGPMFAWHSIGCVRLELTDTLPAEWANISPSIQAGYTQGVQINVRIRRKRGRRSLVERTHQGPMVRLLRRLDGVDARRFRLHRLPPDHGADCARVRGSADRRDGD